MLEGKTAVVTGGHRGIGEAISKTMALAGANIIVIDRKGVMDSTVPKEVKAAGKKHASIQADLNDLEATLRAAREAKEIANEWGTRVNVLVNNAGIALLGWLAEQDNEKWEETFNVNVRAPMVLARELVNGDDGMLAHSDGAIVNITSVAAKSGHHVHTAYCASKAALESVTRNMASEWASKGVRANAVAPTVVLTDMGRAIWDGTPEGKEMVKRLATLRFAEMQEIADVVTFMCSPAASMIHGARIPVDGGFSAW